MGWRLPSSWPKFSDLLDELIGICLPLIESLFRAFGIDSGLAVNIAKLSSWGLNWAQDFYWPGAANFCYG
ncbi:hypothetical protein [Parasynechococcus sp.]|uniref:hypothetical protein n=1 Tax=Parasynechococcus sp. TaxID=3101203 RepID=UPI003703D789